jgi:hypothetical protein
MKKEIIERKITAETQRRHASKTNGPMNSFFYSPLHPSSFIRKHTSRSAPRA